MGMECAAMTIEREEVKRGRAKERGEIGGEGVRMGMIATMMGVVGAKRQLSELRNWIES
jgi:hypothetical protein